MRAVQKTSHRVTVLVISPMAGCFRTALVYEYILEWLIFTSVFSAQSSADFHCTLTMPWLLNKQGPTFLTLLRGILCWRTLKLKSKSSSVILSSDRTTLDTRHGQRLSEHLLSFALLLCGTHRSQPAPPDYKHKKDKTEKERCRQVYLKAAGSAPTCIPLTGKTTWRRGRLCLAWGPNWSKPGWGKKCLQSVWTGTGCFGLDNFPSPGNLEEWTCQRKGSPPS